MAITDNLISYYKFDGDVDDAHGSNNGTNDGTTSDTTNKKLGLASRSFDGSNDSIDLNHVPVTGNNARSFNYWIKTSDNSGLHFSYGAASNYQYFSSRINGSNVIQVSFYGAYVQFTATNVDDGNWHMITITYAGSGTIDDVKVYMDNTELTESASLGKTNALNTGSTYNLELGYLNRSSSNYFSGNIDEVGVWSKELSTSEISDLWNSGSGLAYPFSAETPEADAIFFSHNF